MIMRKNCKLNKTIYILASILILLNVNTWIVFGNDLNTNFEFNIDQFKVNIQSSPKECWKKPAQNRKDVICNKLTDLQKLINKENFEGAYNKLLHDIKPKLTALKTDEHEEPWGNGIFKQAWVICEDLRESFRVECNLILSGINPLSVYDDDKTPPIITITYVGENEVKDPGVWNVDVEDLESGLDCILIEINGITYYDYTNLAGVLSIFYQDIAVPAIIGINEITVIATNNDKDYKYDQETATETQCVEIFADLTPPTINHPEDIEYEYIAIGNLITWIALDDHPGTYTVMLDGGLYASGNWESGVPITIAVDDLSIGTHELLISVSDFYDNLITDSVLVKVNEDDDTIPPIVVITSHDVYHEFSPGFWNVYAADYESGLASVQIFIDEVEYLYEQNLNGIESNSYTDIPIPLMQGEVSCTVIAKDNDNDREGDGESFTEQHTVIIPDGDTSPPAGYISYDGSFLDSNPGTWYYYVEDLESGLGEVLISVDGDEVIHHTDLNGEISRSYTIPVPEIPGTHWIEITSTDYDIDVDGDQATSMDSDVVLIEDDDITEPLITIEYYGSGALYDPGWWNIIVEDYESGLEDVQILLNSVEELHDQDLNGILYESYNIFVPNLVGEYTLTVVVKNNDKDWNGDQQQNIETDYIEIIYDDDTTPPIIFMDEGHNIWNIFIDDFESGIDEAIIEIDENVYIHELNLNGIISMAYYNIHISDIGQHTITVTAKNNDKDFDGDQEISTETFIVKVYGARIAYDDDFTPPTIAIVYEGGYTDIYPGVWHIDVEDLESGLDKVQILLNGVEQIYDQNLEGIISMHYDILVPAIVGIYIINVTAINNDKDHEFDQESNTKCQIIDINSDPAPPSDDDITGPTILIDYVVDGYFEGIWRIYVEDLESGLDLVHIILDGTDFLYDVNLNGIKSKFYQIDPFAYEGLYTIEVFAVNNDKDYPGDQELSMAFKSIYVDETAPTIEIIYEGAGTTSDPGIWSVNIEDPQTGIDKVHVFVDGIEEVYDFNGETPILLSIQVPETEGTHTIEVTALNNDKDYFGDQESSTESALVEIADDDTTPPEIFIVYQGGYSEDYPGIWKVLIKDDESGIGDVLILVDGKIRVEENLQGQASIIYDISVPNTIGYHTIEVFATNNDIDRPGDQESDVKTHTVPIEEYIPPEPM